jgi:NADH-quinone oxidoreductase subunit L
MDSNHKDGGLGREEGAGGFWATLLTAIVLLPVASTIILKGIGGEPSVMLLYIVLLPGLGALFNGTIGQRLPREAVNLVALAAMALAFLFSVQSSLHVFSAGAMVGGQSDYPLLVYEAYEWIRSGSLSLPLKLVMDPLSAVMCLIITGVGLLSHFYSTGYMSEEPGTARYFSYLNLFCCSMLLLVLGGSIPVTFVGWQGVGMCSYLLIGFWFTDEAKAAAGTKAFIVNRVGDFALILAMVILWASLGTLDYQGLENLVRPESVAPLAGVATVVGLLLFLGCTSKSAQIPLFVWLPDAVAGPTPVAAMIHTVTTVAAGVYLIVRMYFVFALSPTVMWVMVLVGGLTAFMAATIALAQNDIKKVLTYSTVSQVGFIFLALGSGAYVAGVFHLVTHAFFMALLFLGAGSVVRGMHHEQDIRKMGGLRKKMKVTHLTFLVGCLAIAGFPLLSGFFSQGEVLWNVFALARPGGSSAWMHVGVWLLGIATAGMTAFYIFRLYFSIFAGECRADEPIREKIEESPLSVVIPLVILAVLAAIGGGLGLPKLMTAKDHFLESWLNQVFASSNGSLVSRFAADPDAEVMWGWVTMSVLAIVVVGGVALFWYVYGSGKDIASKVGRQLAPVHRVLINKYYVDEAYEVAIVKPFIYLGRILHKVVDEFLIDFLMVNGIAWVTESIGAVLRRLQSGNVQRYAAFLFFGLATIIYLMLR